MIYWTTHRLKNLKDTSLVIHHNNTPTSVTILPKHSTWHKQIASYRIRMLKKVQYYVNPKTPGMIYQAREDSLPNSEQSMSNFEYFKLFSL